ncbi:glycosyl transferase family 90 [Prochlorococcus sp. MIT 1307]|uniref:glycosyl transferase family 90 n=1 Tax=Prochlorococcus sp. MIT 1307 TaxID=3096219 RepID=UPI002A7526EF|nr:glycosyl transferase family 90 [Prochlorococcus sp. MIT 1307]
MASIADNVVFNLLYQLLSFINVPIAMHTYLPFQSRFITHSHPRTFRLLGKIAKRHHITLSSLHADPSLIDLTTRIYVRINANKEKAIHIDIPSTLNDKHNNTKRIYNCYSFWIPYCIEISNQLNYSYSLALNASDWGTSNFLSMTSEDKENVIPDEYSMLESKKLTKLESWNSFESFKKSWLARKSIMFWRGSTTGPPIKSTFNLQQLERVQICLSHVGKEGFDMKITNIVQNEIPKQLIRQWLINNNLIGRKINEDFFKQYKYYPDIPGNNQLCGSWGAIRKCLRGNLMFKPNHKSHMYYDRYMEPWKNYIPVESNFLDLEEKFLWAEANIDQASNIAWQGYCVASNYLLAIKNHFIKASLKKIIRL